MLRRTTRLLCSQCRRTASTITGTPSSRIFQPAIVQKAFLDDMHAQKFLTYITGEAFEPFLVRKEPGPVQPKSLIDKCLEDPKVNQCVVDLEVGLYNQREGFQQVQLPLGAYLEWLKEGREGGKMNGKQVYLAQWRGLEEMPSLKHILSPPRFLQGLMDTGTLDLYQASFFIGAEGAVTPLHHDPYINLFSLASGSAEAAKHFTILPPSNAINQALQPSADGGQRNTSPLDFKLVQESSYNTVSVEMTDKSPSQNAFGDIQKAAYGVSLQPGEMLLLPRRWWHRVENIGTPGSWTAGVGYWFRLR